jgi:hypothetical protein
MYLKFSLKLGRTTTELYKVPKFELREAAPQTFHWFSKLKTGVL